MIGQRTIRGHRYAALLLAMLWMTTLGLVGCFDSTGGNVSRLPGNDANVPTCGN